MLGVIDRQVGETVGKAAPEAVAAYKRHAPGRLAQAVQAKRNASTGHRATVTIGKVPLGGKVRGRDPGARAVGVWTDRGTKGPIRSNKRTAFGTRKPLSLPGGRRVQEVRGQKPQNWVPEARRQADAAANVIVEQHLPNEITDQVRRLLG